MGVLSTFFKERRNNKKREEGRDRKRGRKRVRERGGEKILYSASLFFLVPIVFAVVTGQEIMSVLEINYLISLQNALLNTY